MLKKKSSNSGNGQEYSRILFYKKLNLILKFLKTKLQLLQGSRESIILPLLYNVPGAKLFLEEGNTLLCKKILTQKGQILDKVILKQIANDVLGSYLKDRYIHVREMHFLNLEHSGIIFYVIYLHKDNVFETLSYKSLDVENTPEFKDFNLPKGIKVNKEEMVNAIFSASDRRPQSKNHSYNSIC